MHLFDDMTQIISNSFIEWFILLEIGTKRVIDTFGIQFELLMKYGYIAIFFAFFILLWVSIDNYRRTLWKYFHRSTLQILLIIFLIGFLTSFLKLEIPMLGNIVIRFNFLVRTMVSMMFGPIIGGVFAILSEILNYLLKADAPLGLFSIMNAGASAMAIGIFLYDKEFSFWRIFFARLTISVVFNFLFTSFSLHFYLDRNLSSWLACRFSKNIFAFPFECGCCYLFAFFGNSILKGDNKSLYRFGAKAIE